MNPIVFAKRRPGTILMLVLVLISGGVLGLYKMRADIPPLNTPKIYSYLDHIGRSANKMKASVVGTFESYFHKHEEEPRQRHHKIVVTSPKAKDVVITQRYVCQIHSRRHINVQALESGYIEATPVKEGQAVKKDDVMFKIVPVHCQAKLHAAKTEAQLAQLEFNNKKKLFETKVAGESEVSQNDVKLLAAKLAKAETKVELAEAELKFANVKAPFDGIVDRLDKQEGSLVNKGDILTNLSDNAEMYVYFNMSEKRYLEYMAELGRGKDRPEIELELADNSKFAHTGKIGAIEAKFNNATGSIPFRSDFPNPEGLLRHGQTGTVLLNRVLRGAIVIPQRATFEKLANQYVYVVGKDHVVHRREIVPQYELEDLYVIENGLDVNDKIVLEGTRELRDGDQTEYEFRQPDLVLSNLKYEAQ
jgi:membrane fusion protein, multidrug efflux system